MKKLAKTNKQESAFYFLTAFGLINTICFILLLSSLVFSFGGVLSWWHFPLSFILAIVINYFAAYFLVKERKEFYFFRSALIAGVVIIASIFIAGFFYDTSADGLVYHQETVYQLKSGWNPFYTVLPDSVSQSVWINHYPKGAEVPQAAIYGLTHKIETGKATNILLLTAGFFLTMAALSKIGALSYRKRILLSSLLTLNPVAVNQLFTFYVDGQIASLLLCFMAVCTLLYFDSNKYYLFLLGSVMLITINMKFTTLIFIVIFVTGFLTLLLINKKKENFRKVLYLALVAGMLGVGFAGYNPYVKNTLNHHHPFYPLMGKSNIDIIKESYPIGFAQKGRFEKFYISLFAHTDNEGSWPWEERTPSLKIPFAVNKIDISNARTEDTRVAGFGPLFSGILLFSVLLYIISCLHYPNRV